MDERGKEPLSHPRPTCHRPVPPDAVLLQVVGDGPAYGSESNTRRHLGHIDRIPQCQEHEGSEGNRISDLSKRPDRLQP